ncbi:hypothetical protein FKM82_029314 [Ascaphus truei]
MHLSYLLFPLLSALSPRSLCPSLSSLLLLLPLLSALLPHSLCPSLCSCYSGSLFVNCSGTNLSASAALPPPDTELLDLSGCSLRALPPLRLLCRLRTLLLAHNHLSEASSWAGLQSLQSLDLSSNGLDQLSSGFSQGLDSLTQLRLAHNALRSLPGRCFQHLHSLELLELQGNLISSLEPGTLRALTQLRRLRLQGNLLQRLRRDDFSMLQRLELLDLSGNRIRELAPEVFSLLRSLALLSLQHNLLRHLRFQTLRNLPAPGTLLLLSHNPWECDCDLQRVFGKLGGVRRLRLQDAGEVRCAEPPALRGRPLASLDTRLCAAETVTVLVITLTVAVTVVGAVVTAERRRKKGTKIHWSRDSEMCPQD